MEIAGHQITGHHVRRITEIALFSAGSFLAVDTFMDNVGSADNDLRERAATNYACQAEVKQTLATEPQAAYEVPDSCLGSPFAPVKDAFLEDDKGSRTDVVPADKLMRMGESASRIAEDFEDSANEKQKNKIVVTLVGGTILASTVVVLREAGRYDREAASIFAKPWC